MGKAFSTLIIFVFFGFLIFGIHYGIYALLIKEGTLVLTDVEIKGTQVLTRDSVLEMAELDMNKGIFDFSIDAIESRIMENKLVEKVVVKRFPPNRIRIDIKERQSAAVFSQNNKYFIVARDGTVLVEGFMEKLPWISTDFAVNISGEKIQDQFIQLFLDRVADFQNASHLKRVVVKSKEGIFLTFRGLEQTVFFTGRNVPDNKLYNKIESLIAKIKAEKIQVKIVNLNDENAIGYQ